MILNAKIKLTNLTNEQYNIMLDMMEQISTYTIRFNELGRTMALDFETSNAILLMNILEALINEQSKN